MPVLDRIAMGAGAALAGYEAGYDKQRRRGLARRQREAHRILEAIVAPELRRIRADYSFTTDADEALPMWARGARPYHYCSREEWKAAVDEVETFVKGLNRCS